MSGWSALLIGLVALGQGCASRPEPRTIESGPRVDLAQWKALVEGKTTEDEAAALFGEPTRAVVHDDGRAHWIYARGRARANADGDVTKLTVETYSLVFRDGILEHIHRRKSPGEERAR